MCHIITIDIDYTIFSVIQSSFICTLVCQQLEMIVLLEYFEYRVSSIRVFQCVDCGVQITKGPLYNYV